jgi:hypothetical protein
VAFLVRFVGGRTLEDAQDDALLLFGTERQVQIICAAVERLAQIDAGIAERITDYRKLVAFRTVHGAQGEAPNVTSPARNRRSPAQ